jgi:hypothetical protein
MRTFKKYIYELAQKKNQWVFAVSSADKSELSGELVDLVKNAYEKTSEGSFVNSLKDVLPSDWVVIDWDDDPEQDSTVFFRKNRPNEAWKGNKIQGLGHDGSSISKKKVVAKNLELLKKKGWWIEASEAMRHVLLKNGAPVVTDVEFLRKLFKDPDLKMVDKHTYTRKIGSKTITESVFGRPILR